MRLPNAMCTASTLMSSQYQIGGSGTTCDCSAMKTIPHELEKMRNMPTTNENKLPHRTTPSMIS